MRDHSPDSIVHYRVTDFTLPLHNYFPLLDGIVMANSLHFHRGKEPIVNLIKRYLRPNGHLILVEYNIEQGNSAVPYPVSYRSWEELAQTCGFAHTELLHTRPSRFLREIYSAVSW